MDLIGLFFGFWLFLFSRNFRSNWFHDWQSSGLLFRFLLLVEIVVSALVGVGLPFYLINWGLL